MPPVTLDIRREYPRTASLQFIVCDLRRRGYRLSSDSFTWYMAVKIH